MIKLTFAIEQISSEDVTLRLNFTFENATDKERALATALDKASSHLESCEDYDLSVNDMPQG